ncbi:MAG: topoisomerase bacterial [Planctomycetota bacterium]|nr:topoisomerase bacterial [Planctomycetota bacterium]
MARKTTKKSETPETDAKIKAPAKRKAPSATAKTKAKSPATTKAKAAPWVEPSFVGGTGRSLVIVESPKKAKSINKFLGPKFIVKASMGHVRDLPSKGKDLGIDVAHGYRPTYVVMDDKKKTITELRDYAAKCDMVYLATDPDREGEAIAWHLQHALGLADERVRRVKFFEITERAVKEAFTHVGPIDMDKVNAQQARRFLDRFVGYQVSPLLWKKVTRGLSAGRVQSVATRLIADREKEIKAFVSEEYWKITATLAQPGSSEEVDRFAAALTEWRGSNFSAKNEAEARTIRDTLASSDYIVSKLETVEKLDKADAPFKTSTLQQQAAIRLRFSGKRTMKIAQELYEGIDVGGDGPSGLITYMRTDSLRVSDESVTGVREMIARDYGDRYLPAKPNRYAAGKQAQEAHEAIRPTELSLVPEAIRTRLTPDQFKLYQLIYRRFVASQMTPAKFEVTNVEVTAGDGLFKTQGKILRFDGYRRVLPPAGKQEDALLPPLVINQPLDLIDLEPTQHFTQPPPRYSEATLVKALEKDGIGRPSTYAPIIQTIQDRKYVEQKERRFFATELGMVVTDLLVEHFPKILDLKFTAHMEDELDEIADAKIEMVQVLDEFYGPFQASLAAAETGMQKVQITSDEVCHKCGAPMLVKYSKGEPFLSCSTYPECKATRPRDGGPRIEAIETEHVCTKCGKPLMLREGKRGQFLSCSGYPGCKESYNLDAAGNPVPSVVETDHACPKCGKPMALRQGARGAFLGCTGYPKCRNTMPVDDSGKPVAPVVVDVKCEKCGGPMGVKQGRRGAFLGCLAYPKCRSTAPIPDDLKSTLGEAALVPAAAKGPDLKAIEVDETCDNCGGAMTIRPGRRGYFLGCRNYPKCKGTKEPSEATLEKITAATAV